MEIETGFYFDKSGAMVDLQQIHNNLYRITYRDYGYSSSCDYTRAEIEKYMSTLTRA